MSFKAFIIVTFLAAVNAGYLSTPAPIAAYTAAPTIHSPAAVTSQSANIIRSPGNLGQVSTFTKTVDTPYSSVSKSDVRVSNPGYTTYTAAPPKSAVAFHVTPAPVQEHVVTSAPVHNVYPTIYRSSPGVGPALPNAYSQPAVLAPGHASSYLSPLTQHLSPAAVYHQPSVAYNHPLPTPSYQYPSAAFQHPVPVPGYQYPSASLYQHPIAGPTYQHSAGPVYHQPVTSHPYNYPVVPSQNHPLLGVAYSHAPMVSRMSFDGHGINYTY